MKKVPNIVFLIIAIVGLTTAGIIFAMYSSEKERALTSLTEIIELEKDVNNLMNKNSELMLQMTGIEDQKDQLEAKAKKDSNCWITKENKFSFNEVVSVKGYYSQEERDDFRAKSVCDIFTITEAPENFYFYLQEMTKDHEGVDLDEYIEIVKEDEDGNFIVNISLDSNVLEDGDKDKIKSSTNEDLINLFLYSKDLPNHEFPACYSNLEILGVK